MGGLNNYGELKHPGFNLSSVAPVNSKFICPACDEKASIKNGNYCRVCAAFVHTNCSILKAFRNQCYWSYYCSICDSVLGRARNKTFWENVKDCINSY